MSHKNTIQRVEHSIHDVFAAVDAWFDAPEPLRTYQPADGGWTINLILEHITLTSFFLLKIIRKGVVKAKKRAQTRSITATESDLDMINVIGDPDAFDWIRPEHMEPTGTPSLSSVRQSMTEQRDECLSLLRRMPDGEGSLYTVRMSVQELGKIDMYQWIYFLVQHAYRHHIEMLRIQQEYLEN